MARARFPKDVKKQCWEMAKKMMNRDPSRWRLDALGTPVLKALHGKNGLCAWQYDHKVPVKLDGQSDLSNCQVLQTAVNKRKSMKVFSDEDFKRLACSIKLNESQLDIVEMAVHGNLRDENGVLKCSCLTKDQELGVAGIRKKKVKPCAVQEACSREPACLELQEKVLQTVLKDHPEYADLLMPHIWRVTKK